MDTATDSLIAVFKAKSAPRGFSQRSKGT